MPKRTPEGSERPQHPADDPAKREAYERQALQLLEDARRAIFEERCPDGLILVLGTRPGAEVASITANGTVMEALVAEVKRLLRGQGGEVRNEEQWELRAGAEPKVN